MSLIDLKYNFHDSWLRAVRIGPRSEVELTISLYPIYYPTKPTVRVHFGGIFNFEKVKSFLESLVLPPGSDAIERFETMHSDIKRPSKEGDVFTFLELDHSGQLRIHSQHVSVEEIPSTGTSERHDEVIRLDRIDLTVEQIAEMIKRRRVED